MQPLPIDEVLPSAVETQRRASNLVLEAPPGAGKTTRVPTGLFDAQVTGGGDMLVAEPRRLAARLAARRVADERGERLGDLVGYAVRFDTRVSPRTRVRYVTYGVLLRQLLSSPDLDGVGLVVLDEFHERQLASDLGLTLLRRLQRSTRPNLKLVVMSATLDAASVAHFLDNCPRLTSAGRRYDVKIEHDSAPDDRPLAKQVVSAVKRARRETPPGDILVFLPGAAEIRQAATTLADTAREQGLLVAPLHGDLPVDQQARAVERTSQRKVVLSTNVAESSITIDGVTVVVDCGLARVPTSSPWSGLPALSTRPISRASARQRAGRAGRTAPGVVYRLYTRGDYDRRPEQDALEISRADLTEGLLVLHGAGVQSPSEVEWLTPPPEAAQASAERLLHRLGALDMSGALTPIGQRMLDLPVHPRLARVLVERERLGIADEAVLAAALLSERDVRTAAWWHGDSTQQAADSSGLNDVEELCERFHEAAGLPARRVRALGLDPRAIDTVARSAEHLGRTLRNAPRAPATSDPSALAIALLRGYPDRVARRRELGSRDLLLASGEVARLSPQSCVEQRTP